MAVDDFPLEQRIARLEQQVAAMAVGIGKVAELLEGLMRLAGPSNYAEGIEQSRPSMTVAMPPFIDELARAGRARVPLSAGAQAASDCCLEGPDHG